MNLYVVIQNKDVGSVSQDVFSVLKGLVVNTVTEKRTVNYFEERLKNSTVHMSAQNRTIFSTSS